MRNGKRAKSGERAKKRSSDGEVKKSLAVILHPLAQEVADEVSFDTQTADAASFLASLGGEMERQTEALQPEDELEESDE